MKRPNPESRSAVSASLHLDFLLRAGDNCLVLGQRLAEWCGHGPVLEQDIALTNVALDLIGQARHWLQRAAELEGKGRSEDDLAFLRVARQYRNLLLVELPNRDFAHTILRQFFFDQYHALWLEAMTRQEDPPMQAIAAKSLKEVRYHLRYSSEWVIRLGDGTAESRKRMEQAMEAIWPYAGEALMPDEVDRAMAEAGLAPDLGVLAGRFFPAVEAILKEATLPLPAEKPYQQGGKQGRHTEHLDYLLAEMQYMQRTYPNMEW